jgi:hypothetical protein
MLPNGKPLPKYVIVQGGVNPGKFVKVDSGKEDPNQSVYKKVPTSVNAQPLNSQLALKNRGVQHRVGSSIRGRIGHGSVIPRERGSYNLHGMEPSSQRVLTNPNLKYGYGYGKGNMISTA